MRFNRLLIEALTRQDALRVFAHYGVNASDMDAAQLKRAYRALAMQHHPDRHGGDDAAMKAINDAYDTLTNFRTRGPEPGRRSSARPRHSPGYGDSNGSGQRDTGTPPWAWAGESGGMPPSGSIYRQDYRDVNFIKKRMWELSGQSREEWTIQGFDGHFMRGMVTVYGAPKIFAQMAEAMITWQTKGGNPYACRAVLVSPRRSQGMKYIIWADGVFYDKDPIPFEDDEDDRGRPHRLADRLTRVLDDLQENGRPQEQSAFDMKGANPERADLDVGAYVVHKKYGVGRIINLAVKKNTARVAFRDGQTANVKLANLRPATAQEARAFEARAFETAA